MKAIKLTEKDVAKARDFAFKLIRSGRKGCFENYFVGTLGEIAYGKFTKQKVNFEVYERFKGDDGADFKDAQVKTVGWAGEDKLLKVSTTDKSLKNPNVVKYILAYASIRNPEHVVLIGEVSKERFVKEAYLRQSWGCLVMSEHKLDKQYE